MNMSKNQIVMAGIGGVALVGAALLGYFAYAAWTEKGETADDLESAKDRVQRILRAEISADAASVAEIKKNRDMVAGWREAALSTASAGDRAVNADVNEAAFKQKLVDEARNLAKLPGGVDGAIVKPDFTFGFPDFVSGDKIPEKEKLPQLQRQWGDIRQIVEMLSTCGVVEIVRIEPKSSAPDAQQQEKPKKGRKAKKGEGEEKPPYTVETYEVDFRAKSAALVKALNAFAVAQRFFVVDTFSFAREGDMIATALGEGDKKAAADQPTSGRRRRRPSQEQPVEAAPAAAEDNAKKGIANDPSLEAPFLVKLAVSTYDFGSAVQPAEAAPAAEASEAAETSDAAKEKDSEKKEDEE
ncbi:MAG: Amuc_1100 family pilus-like protein [Kiritimatiellae bacterium]|nr:Amuc_1100 family pilus-like protein [Kiritimatiellia bacterium]